MDIFWNRKAISNFVQCLHSQLHIIRSIDICFFSLVRFKFPCEYEYDLGYGQHFRASYTAITSWPYSWPTQFHQYFVFCQLTLKCKCWTIEAFVYSLFRIILFWFSFIVLRRLVGGRRLIYYISIYHLLLFRLLMIQWINLIQWKCQNVKKKRIELWFRAQSHWEWAQAQALNANQRNM